MVKQKTLEKIISSGKKFLACSALILGLAGSSKAAEPAITSISINNPSTGAVTNQGYYTQNNPLVSTEKRVYYNGQHFLSILTTNGIFAIRPHPGVDVDGWGSTLYLQPYINGAVLGHTTNVQYNIVTNGGIPALEIIASGGVSWGASSTYGTWSTKLDFVSNPSNKTLDANGNYKISLPGSISGLGDLYFYKLASNFLKGVPVNNGSVTNTGDMKIITYKGDGFWQNEMKDLVWNPAITGGGHFPGDLNTYLEVRLTGDENIVDTVRQGYEAIAQASKPNLDIILQATNSNMKVSFGTTYVPGLETNPYADNIGVTPWINSAGAVTNYIFNINLHSSAITNDNYSSEINLVSTDPTNKAYGGIYYTPSPTNSFNRIGSIKKGSSNYSGKFKSKDSNGFFLMKREL